jgi:hypothetical protein
MKAGATALVLITTVVGGLVLYGHYIANTTHSETGPVAQLLGAGWFFILLIVVLVAAVTLVGVAGLVLGKR